MLAVDVHELTKTFGMKKVVDNVSLCVEQGEIYGFLGPNGSGKTTSIRLMCGLLTPDSGYGSCLGYDILKESQKIKAKVGYMTQKFAKQSKANYRFPFRRLETASCFGSLHDA